MPLKKEQIRIEAMKLDPADREALAEELLLSIDEDGRDAIDAAWLAEAKRRDAAFQKGKTAAKPVESVIERLKSRVTP
jgi:putative addiction module component (TIGR02574 family)